MPLEPYLLLQFLTLRSVLLLTFWPLTASILFLDSRALSGQIAYGQWLSNAITPLFLLAVMSQLKPRQQLVLALFVPLSAIGEAIFCLALGLYEYRLGGVPLYVPFGHSILLGMAWLFEEEAWLRQRERLTEVGLAFFHAALIIGALLLFNDTLSFLWGLLFCIMCAFQKRRNTYLIVGVLVLYIEILGTGWHCWEWKTAVSSVLQTANPPVGAFACYSVGEILAILIAARFVAPPLKRVRESVLKRAEQTA